jgi:prepilin-type N-terminal cleavage/methylation domain-containing protein
VDVAAGTAEHAVVKRTDAAFTLIELLVVISIIAVLIGLAFPAFQGVQNSAKRAQVKNDLLQIVTSVNAYYTEYGKYPVGASASAATDVTYGAGTGNIALMRILMAKDAAENPRQIAFLSPPIAKEDGGYGIYLNADGVPTSNFNSPWSKPAAKVEYKIRIDADYDGQVVDPDQSSTKLPIGVIAWSPGKNADVPKIYSHK